MHWKVLNRVRKAVYNDLVGKHMTLTVNKAEQVNKSSLTSIHGGKVRVPPTDSGLEDPGEWKFVHRTHVLYCTLFGSILHSGSLGMHSSKCMWPVVSRARMTP